MEVLKNQNDAPILVTNIEALQILSQKREQISDQQNNEIEGGGDEDNIQNDNNNGHNQRRKNKKFRHRDFIESHVLQYLEESPCGNADFEKIPGLVKSLQPKKKIVATRHSENYNSMEKGGKKKNKKARVIDDDDDDDGMDDDNIPGKENNNEEEDDDDRKKGFELAPFEILQVLNLMPTEKVELHLIIDEISKRIPTDEKQDELIELIQSYIIKPEEEEGQLAEEDYLDEEVDQDMLEEMENMEVDDLTNNL
eukprot:CAMPEP_0178956844 /NCGR_PEP_ID=MMETSP0789-20121207/10521_1 /TAXON_ID=3005 /ORGANISM="Rhizosolenia setigera, Strain CCMP 1694" /LENGTH=252 /DNA_ID=CAMNT_0020638901 /DNA_START=72 /DNA_END=830 /DNA_ORIENTATION=-